jgi:hypothetical protein
MHNELCRRQLLFQHRTPILRKRGGLWIYHFPERHQATLICPRDNNQATHTVHLFEAGLLLNASQCSVTMNELRNLPELHGLSQATLDTAHIYIPDTISILANHEIPLLTDGAESTSPDRRIAIQTCDTVACTWRELTVPHTQRVTMPRTIFTVAFSTHHSYMYSHSPWNNLYFLLYAYPKIYHTVLLHPTNSTEPSSPITASTNVAPEPAQRNLASHLAETQPEVMFQTYSTQYATHWNSNRMISSYSIYWLSTCSLCYRHSGICSANTSHSHSRCRVAFHQHNMILSFWHT